MPKPKAQRQIKVYLTGFGPFMRVTNNPSWLIVSQLKSTTQTVTTSQAVYTIIYTVHHSPVPVVYDKIDEIVKEIWAEGGFDYILHCGVGSSGPYQLETCGSEFGYKIPDNEGKVPPSNPNPLSSSKATSTTTLRGQDDRTGASGELYKSALPIEAIVKFINDASLIDIPNNTPSEPSPPPGKSASKPNLKARPKDEPKPLKIVLSTNAGLFCCEYIFSRSLIQQKLHDDNGKGPKALFMHCCPENVPYSIQGGAEVLKKVIEGVIREGEKSSKS